MRNLNEVLSEAVRVAESEPAVLQESIDYFEEYELIPDEVQAVLDKFLDSEEEQQEYNVMKKAVAALKPLGWRFDYDLDGIPFELEPFNSKGKALLKKK